jgi:hypothetical protein
VYFASSRLLERLSFSLLGQRRSCVVLEHRRQVPPLLEREAVAMNAHRCDNTFLRIEPPARVTGAAPSFAELNSVHDRFFRRGTVGSYRDEMPQDVEQLFWAQPHHAEAMALLGYTSP